MNREVKYRFGLGVIAVVCFVGSWCVPAILAWLLLALLLCTGWEQHCYANNE